MPLQSARWTLVQAVRQALVGVDGTSLVVLTDPVDLAAGRAEGLAADIARVTGEGSGKWAVELYAGDDEDVDGPPGGRTTGIDTLEFVVSVRGHLPQDLNGDGAAEAAADFARRIYGLVSPPTAAGGRFGGLALHSTYLGGGALKIDAQLGTRCVDAAFAVRYRVREGDGRVSA